MTASPVAEGGLGKRMYALVEALYPICRSITGNGVRQSLALIGKHIPIKVTEVSSGTKVFDWVVPREWNITDAYIANASGERVHEFRDFNLHVLNYSIPVRKVLPLEALRSHIYTLPDSAGSCALPDLLLRGTLGLLHEPACTGRAAARRLHRRRGVHAGGREVLPTANAFCPERAMTKFFSRPTSAIRPLPTTTAQGLPS